MRAVARIGTVALVAAALAVGLTACSKTKGRTVDVKAGEYFSEDELLLMSNGERDAYCKALAAERDRLQKNVESNQEDLAATRKRVEGLRAQIGPVDREKLRIESDIRSLTAQIAQLEALPRRHKVQLGETLSTIAQRPEIYGDWTQWPRIYRANLAKIPDPLYVFPDTTLVIPRELPTQHKVAPFETLEMIAGYWEVYGDPTQWVRLYEANRAKVKDPMKLDPGIILVIPR